MNKEIASNKNHIIQRRLAPAAALIAAAISIAGCGKGATNEQTSANKEAVSSPATKSTGSSPRITKPESTTTTETANIRGYHKLMPNLTGFCPDISISCSAVLYLKPRIGGSAVNILNQVPAQPQGTWPVANDYGVKGNYTEVSCYINNGESMGWSNSTMSKDWYKVAVPIKYVINPDDLYSLANPKFANPPIPVFKFAGQKAINAWAPISEFHETSPAPEIPLCPA